MSNWRSLTNGSATKNTGWRSLVPDYKPNSVSNTYSNDEESDERNDDYTKYLKQLLAEQGKQRQLMSQQNAMNETQDSGAMSAQSAMRNGQTWQQKYQTYSDEIDKALNTPNAAYNASMNTQTRARNASQRSDASITTSAKLQQQMEQQVSGAKKQRAADLPGLESKLNGESKPDEIVQAENSLKSPGNLLSNSGTDKNNVFSDSLGGVTPLKQYANNARTVKNYNESTHLTPSEELEYSQAKIEALSDGEQQALAGIKASQKSTGNYLSGGATGSYIKELQQINGSAKYYDTLKKDYGWDQNKIDEYTGYTQRLANAENTEENNQKFSINKDDSTLTKIGKSARNSAYSLANSGSSEYLSLLSNLEDKPKGFGKDSNSWTNSARNASDYAQEQVVNNAITDKHPVGQFAYNAGMSTAESGLNAIYGAAVGGALGSTGALANVAANTASLSQFAASAYNSAYDDARERGASDKQAQELGVINGLVEAGTEVVSLDKVWDLAKGNIRGARNILTNWLTQAGIEGSEEFAGDILDKYADTMVLGKDGNSAKQKSIEAYMAQGMTEEDAKKQYDKDFLKQLGEDTLAGAVSGAVMGAGGLYAGSQNAKNDTARLNDIKNVYSNSKMEGNSDFANSANTMAETYSNNPTQYLADNVNDSTDEGKKHKQDLQKYADKENSGKKLSISDKNDIENILYENEQSQTGDDNSDYRDQLRYVPSEYRTPVSNVSRQDTQTAMESAAQSGDVNALADAYQRGKMSTSADTRDNLEEDYDIAKRMLLNKGTVSTGELDKATESQQDAYLSGLNGEEADVKSMTDRAATAYTAGYNQYVSNNANSKVGNDVDLHSVTAEDDSGRVTKVAGFASATSNNGQREISLKTADGNSISYSNANISNTGVAKLYDNAAKQGTVDDMNAYLDNYVKEMPIGQYDNAFNRYYSQGASGTKSFDGLYNSDKYGYKSFMSKNQLQKIYNIGANETAGQLLENAKAEGKSIAVKGTGAVTDLRHNRSDSSYMPFVSSMAKALNLDVVLSDNMEDGINGQFERALQRVTLNTKNKDAMFNTVFHEAFGEYMQAHNAAGANRVRSAVLSYISDTKGADYVSSVGKTYQKAYTGVEGTKTFSDALGESVNDSISGIFSTEEGIHDLRTWLDSKYDEKKSRGILGDIADYFKGVAASLRSLIKDGHLSTASMNTAEMAEKRASDIRKMILKEMDTAAKNAAGTTVDASTKGKANYSLEMDDVWESLVNSYDNKQGPFDDMQISLDSASSILAEGAEALKNTEVNKSTVRKVASEIIHNTGSSYGTMALANNLEKAFAYMQSTDNVDYKDLMRVLEEVAQPVIETSNTTVGKESYKEFMHALKGYKVSLTSKQLAEVKRAYGSLSTFKRLVPGMTFSQNENLSLDSVWDEISAMTGGILDYDTNEGDMPFALADAVEAMKPQVKNNFGGNNRQVAYDTALDIVEKYFGSAATDAANADAKKQINAAKMKMAETNRNYKAKVREQYSAKVKEERQKALAAGKQKADTVVASLKEKQKETLAKLREEKNDDKHRALREQANHYQERISNIIKQKNAATLDKVASVRAANDKRYQKAAEHRKAMHEKAMIDSSATKLFKWLTSPTDTYHIPNDLQKAVSDYISGIDFLSPQINSFTDPKSKTTKYQVSVYDHEARKFVKKVANTQAEAYQIYQNAIEAGLGTRNDRKWRDRMSTLSTLLSKGEMSSDDTTMNDFLQGVDASLAEDFEKILKDNDNTVRLSDLSSSDLHTINMLTRNVMSAINHINKAFTSNARISDLAESTINSETKSRKEHGKTVNDLLGLLQVKNATPETYFHFLGEGGQKVYKMLRSDGLNQRTRDVRAAGDYMKGVLKGISRVDKWSTDTHEFDTIENKKIQLNTAQIMTLYEYTKREQAMMHLPGGFSVEKTKINGKEVTQKGLHLSDAQIENIAGTLTEEQKTVADKMQQFMATECSEWGNRASRSMFGYDKFGDKDYFPIRTEESTHQTQNNNVSNNLINSIKNQGFTKQVVINANNPLVLSDIFDVFTRHVTGMAAYDAYAPAISDALRWYNYRTVETGKDGYKSYGNTVKDAISRVYGDEGKSYFVKLIQNINGNEKGGSELNVIDKAITGFKASAVGANLRVVIQQPTAYFRANNVLSPKYLTQAMLEMEAYSSDAKAAYKMQDQTSDISWWKSQGYWETSIGKSMKAMVTGSETALDKSKNALMALAGKADDITWRKLYLATYLEQKSAFGKAGKSIDGVDFENAVNDRFDEMIDRTQVVDSTLHRSQLMRSNDTKDKLFTSFMSEPTKSYNMLMRAAYDAYSDKDHARGARTVARAAVTYFVTSLATECAASLFDATRNDDDKDWWEKYLASLTENYIDDLNPLSLIPFAKDISELVSPYAKKWIAELTGNTDEESTYTTSSEDMSIAAITNLLDAANTDMQYLFQHTSTLTPYGILKKNARALSQITGIPVYNIIRDSVAVYNTLSDVGNWKKLYSKQSDVKAYYKREFTSSIESGTGIEKALDDYVANGQKLESAENMITDAYKEEYLNLYNEDPEKAKAFADKLNKAYTEVDKLSGAEHDVDKDTTRYENWLKNSDAGKKEKADVFTSIDNGGDYKKEINDALEVGYSYDSIKSSLTSTYKPKFIEAYKSNKSDAAKIKNRLAEVYAYLSDQTGTYKGKSHAYKVKQYSKDIDDWLR